MAELMQSENGAHHGVVVQYNAERGFGFIRPQGSADTEEDNVFFHISNVAGRKTLRPGQHVTYRVQAAERGPEAVAVQPGSVLTIPKLTYGLLGLGLTAIVFIGIGMWFGWPRTPGMWWGLWMFSASAACFLLFGFDKTRARVGGTRVPEDVLKGLSIIGGWPGGFAGMRVFHHKTQKKGFLSAFWPVYVLEASVLVFLLLRF